MNFEELQAVWQSQEARTAAALSSVDLLQETRSNWWKFKRTLFWRDFREAGIGLMLATLFLWHGIRDREWPMYVLAAAGLFVVGFILVDRFVRRKASIVYEDDIRHCVESALAEVTHQVWLLKNVAWWYLAPLAFGCLCHILYSAWKVRAESVDMAIVLVLGIGVVAGIFYWVYALNQSEVRKHLDPWRKELEQLLAELDSGRPAP